MLQPFDCFRSPTNSLVMSFPRNIFPPTYTHTHELEPKNIMENTRSAVSTPLVFRVANDGQCSFRMNGRPTVFQRSTLCLVPRQLQLAQHRYGQQRDANSSTTTVRTKVPIATCPLDRLNNVYLVRLAGPPRVCPPQVKIPRTESGNIALVDSNNTRKNCQGPWIRSLCPNEAPMVVCRRKNHGCLVGCLHVRSFVRVRDMFVREIQLRSCRSTRKWPSGHAILHAWYHPFGGGSSRVTRFSRLMIEITCMCSFGQCVTTCQQSHQQDPMSQSATLL